MKYDLSGCSIIIPVEIDFLERQQHLNFQLNYFNRFFSNYELIIMETGKESKLTFKNTKQCRFEFLSSPHEFSMSAVCNQAVKLIKTPFFCKFDVDLLINPKALYDALKELKKHLEKSFVIPFDGTCFMIKEPFRSQLLSSFKGDELPFVAKKDLKTFQQANIFLMNTETTGGIHFFRTSTFIKMGGYNQLFIGWGYEDNELINRFEKFDYPRSFLQNYNVFHFEHPRLTENLEHSLSNFVHYQMVKKLTKDQLKEYIASWNFFTDPKS